MKNLIFKKLSCALAVALSTATFQAHGAGETDADIVQREAVLNSLLQDRVSLPTTRPGGRDQTGLPPKTLSQEGLGAEMASQEDLAFVTVDAVDAVYALEKALNDRDMRMGEGERLQFLENQIRLASKVSGLNYSERGLRISLNRTLEVARAVLPYIGYNTPEGRRWMLDFYVESIRLALKVSNHDLQETKEDGRIVLKAQIKPNSFKRVPSLENASGDELKNAILAFPSADVGREWASHLFSYTGQMTHQSAKALMLMLVLKHLSIDIANDFYRDSRPLAQVLVEIGEIQYSKSFREIIGDLREERVDRQNVATLRLNVSRLLKALPSAMAEVKSLSKLGPASQPEAPPLEVPQSSL